MNRALLKYSLVNFLMVKLKVIWLTLHLQINWNINSSSLKGEKMLNIINELITFKIRRCIWVF